MCSKGVAKCLLVVFNITFFLLGLGIMVVGIVVMLDKDFLLKYLSNVPVGQETIEQALDSLSMLENLAIALIVGGVIVLAIGFCGCCGAIKEVKCLLLIYAVFVFLIIALQITVGVLAYFYRDDVETKVQNYMLNLITDYYTGATLGSSNTLQLSEGSKLQAGVSDAWDFTMAYFQCCGAYNYTDFGTSATNWAGGYNITSGGSTSFVAADVPVTCCKMNDSSVFPSDLASVSFTDLNACITTASSTHTNQIGCYDAVKDWAKTYFWAILGVGIAFGVIEIVGLFAAICLYRQIGKDADGQHV